MGLFKGINFLKNGSDPIAKLEEEYPFWLWELLDEEKQKAQSQDPNSRSYHRRERKKMVKNNNFDRSRKK
ncbi:7812_t:CDS:2 [Dentiscutata erythropus]|uniref:Large ribosomal subunit protein mL54 n=1 Tax=Dentiscutata erythropus TaxID=1348616 RepID=A0A9N9HAF8_9GLOM|nr:7812_t:CDS:2 [Dentiscutata erythropus]